ncbi:MAG: AI-2E family transporter [Chitinophagaceae bacterium]
MTPKLKQYPFYLKSTVIIFGLTLCCYALSSLRAIIAPIAFSVVIAILLNPIVNFLCKRKLNRGFSVFIALLIAIGVFGGIMYFISSELVKFTDNMVALKGKFNEHIHSIQTWIAAKFKISVGKQQQTLGEAMSNSKALLGTAVGGVFSAIGFFVLVPVYTFMLLYFKTLFLNFFYESFPQENTDKVSEVFTETKKSIQSYMVGLLLEALVVAVLNSTALLLLGVDYAILLGVIGALLNILPYIGGLIAILLPVILSTVTQDSLSVPLLIIICYIVIQFVDNHFLVPFLVSSRVRINAFFSIVIVLLGGALWGVSGMFLSIPFVAILKIIFDRVPELKPWGKLLGDEVPTRHKGEIRLRRKIPSKNAA